MDVKMVLKSLDKGLKNSLTLRAMIWFWIDYYVKFEFQMCNLYFTSIGRTIFWILIFDLVWYFFQTMLFISQGFLCKFLLTSNFLILFLELLLSLYTQYLLFFPENDCLIKRQFMCVMVMIWVMELYIIVVWWGYMVYQYNMYSDPLRALIDDGLLRSEASLPLLMDRADTSQIQNLLQ